MEVWSQESAAELLEGGGISGEGSTAVVKSTKAVSRSSVLKLKSSELEPGFTAWVHKGHA